MLKLMQRMKRAFTLIEMLVVIAIIAILAALLVGPIGRAQENARKAYCLNNVKEIAMAAELVYAELDGVFPRPSAPENPGSRAEVLLPYLGNNFDVFNCPSQHDAAEYGDAFQFPTNTEHYTDYEINGYLMQGVGTAIIRSMRMVTDTAKAAFVYDIRYWDETQRAHRGGVNVGYLDGHGSWLPEELMGDDSVSANCMFYNFGHDVYEIEEGPSSCDGE